MNNTAEARRVLQITENMRADFAALGPSYAREVAAVDHNLVKLRADLAEHEAIDAAADRAFSQICAEGF